MDTANNKIRIIIIMPAWVGDMVMAQTLLKYLKFQYPQCIIDIVAPASTALLSTRMAEIRQSFILDSKHGEFALKKRWRLAQQLSKNNYDWAIILPNSWKSALLPWLARVPRRTGWRGEWRYGLINDIRILDKQKLPLMIQRFLQLGCKKTATPLSFEQTEVFWPTLISTPDQHPRIKKATGYRVLALCPGAEYGPSKRWPAEYFAAIAEKKIAEGWQVWIIGGPKDTVSSELIASKCSNSVYNFCGKTNLIEAIDLLAQSDLVISNDSGLMHIASALQRPVIAIYGSSSAAFTPPLSKKIKMLSINLACSPCFARTCKFGHYHCLTQLLPEQVDAASQATELCA